MYFLLCTLTAVAVPPCFQLRGRRFLSSSIAFGSDSLRALAARAAVDKKDNASSGSLFPLVVAAVTAIHTFPRFAAADGSPLPVHASFSLAFTDASPSLRSGTPIPNLIHRLWLGFAKDSGSRPGVVTEIEDFDNAPKKEPPCYRARGQNKRWSGI